MTNAEEKVVRVSSEEIIEAVKSVKEEYEELLWNGLTIIVRNTIEPEEVVAFVEHVVDKCFDSETGEFTPHNKDFLFRTFIIHFYTNIDLPLDNANELYNIMYGTNLLESVLEFVDGDQLRAVTNAANSAIEHRLNTEIAGFKDRMNTLLSLFESFAASINAFTQGVDADAINEMAKKVNSYDTGELLKALIEK